MQDRPDEREGQVKKNCFSKLERKSICISFKYCIQLRLWREKYNLLSNLQSYEWLSWSWKINTTMIVIITSIIIIIVSGSLWSTTWVERVYISYRRGYRTESTFLIRFVFFFSSGPKGDTGALGNTGPPGRDGQKGKMGTSVVFTLISNDSSPRLPLGILSNASDGLIPPFLTLKY